EQLDDLVEPLEATDVVIDFEVREPRSPLEHAHVLEMDAARREPLERGQLRDDAEVGHVGAADVENGQTSAARERRGQARDGLSRDVEQAQVRELADALERRKRHRADVAEERELLDLGGPGQRLVEIVRAYLGAAHASSQSRTARPETSLT